MRFSILKTLLLLLVAGGILVTLLYARVLDSSYQQPQGLLPQFLTLLEPDHTKADLIHPPLRTKGRNILDANGKRVKLASINWYGASDEQFIPGGLDVQHRSEIAKVIRYLGFNSVRLPYSDEMVVENPPIPPFLLAANRDLSPNSRALDVYWAVVESLTEAGIAVIVNNHITQATWCCGINPCDAAWANDELGALCRMHQTEAQWIQNWETIMDPLINNSLVIAADLRNEVRGLWGTMGWDRWATAAEHAGNRLLEMQSNFLIVVEGTSSSNDLSGVANRPVILNIPYRLVYSSHVYSWSGWGSFGGRYSTRKYASFAKSMQENWGFLLENNVVPVWLGEFGAPNNPGPGDANYWENLMIYLKEIDADFGYWAINPRKPHDNVTETYGILEDDWKTPILDYRMRDMIGLMK